MGDRVGQLFESIGFPWVTHGSTPLKPWTTRGLPMGGSLATHGPPLNLYGLPMGGSWATHALGDLWATYKLLL